MIVLLMLEILFSNKQQIAVTAVDRMLTQFPTFSVPTGRSNCEDDIVDILEAVAENMSRGGNDEVWDAANYYVTGTHIQGEEAQSAYAVEQARDIAILVIQNKDVSDMVGQVKDLTITDDTAPPDNPTTSSVLTK